MQTVPEVVCRQLVFFAVYRQLSVLYAVGVAAYRRAEVARTVHRVGILGYVVITEHNISGLPVLVWHNERNHSSAEVCYAHLHAVGVFQGVKLYGFLIDCCVESGRVKS